MGCYASIPESNIGVVENCGQFDRMLRPGCHCLNCCTEKVAKVLSLGTRQFTHQFNTRIKNGTFVTLHFSFMIRVDDGSAKGKSNNGPPAQLRMNVNDDIAYHATYDLIALPEGIIAREIESHLLARCMEYELDDIFRARENITHALSEELNRKLNPHGYVILNFLVTDINPGAQLVSAMDNVQIAERNRVAAITNAEAQKTASILNAEAQAKVRELEGAGIAAQRRRIVEGLQESVQHFKEALPDTNAHELLTTVLMTQYLDVLKDQAQHGRNTFIMPSSPAHVRAIEGEIGMALLGTKAP